MTHEDAIKFLSNTKVYVQGKSKEIQEKLFSLGFQRQGRGKEVLFTEKPFLFIWNDMNIRHSDDMDYFTNKALREITVDDILNIVIDEQKYRPFNDSEECFEEMKKHEPFSYITDFDGEYYSVVRICEQVVIFGDGKLKNYEEILNEGYRFADGTPFGIKEEES